RFSRDWSSDVCSSDLTPWLGWALVASITLATTAFIIEHYRRNPLLQTRWLSSPPVLHFIFGAFLLRFLTTEQSYGVVGLMRVLRSEERRVGQEWVSRW